jgi:anti-sigma B factor antagonist
MSRAQIPVAGCSATDYRDCRGASTESPLTRPHWTVEMDESARFGAFIAHQDGCVIVVVEGELGMPAVAAFRAVVDQAIAASSRLVIDMADVTFLDSIGLRVLAVARRSVGANGTVTVRRAPEHVARVLHLAGMDGYITVEARAELV